MISDLRKRPLLVDTAVAFFAGAVCVLAWEPLAVPLLGILAYAILFLLVLSRRGLLQISFVSLSFAVGLHTFGHGWVFDSLINQAHTGLVFALLGSSIFIAYLAIFTIVPSIVFVWWHNRFMSVLSNSKDTINHRMSRFDWIVPFVFAACLTLGEFARSLFFSGFSSLSLGYAFVNSLAKSWIPVLGVYSVSFLALSLSASCALLLYRFKFSSTKTVFLPALASIALMLAGGLVLESVQWVKPEGIPLTFRLIQGNVQQKDKFDALKLNEQITRYVDTITSRPATLIVTPETALPLYASQLPTDVWQRLNTYSSDTLSNIFLGIAALASNNDGYNSVFHIAPNQNQATRYDKVTLMPFGEYSPTGFSWFTKKLSVSLKDLSPGSVSQAPFVVRTKDALNSSLQIGSLICHEDLRGQDMRHWLPQANILLNPSNLSWFDGSIALNQRIQIVQARALESGRPILRVANTGITAHIDQFGMVLSQLPLQFTGELSGLVQGQTGLTPYAHYGDIPILIFLLMIVGYATAASWLMKNNYFANTE